MTFSDQPRLTALDIRKLRRIRASLSAFQNSIAALPAQEMNNASNQQFNQLRHEAKIALNDPNFDRKVPRAMTTDLLAERINRVIIPRLFLIITLGVFLALVGLGVNSIILDDVIINSLGCLVSTIGIFLVIGSAIVFWLNQSSGRLSNYGHLYQLADSLRQQIEPAISESGIEPAAPTETDFPELPTITELRLDSLHKQLLDWQDKLESLRARRTSLDQAIPSELATIINIVQQELNRVQAEIETLTGRIEAAWPRAESEPFVPTAEPEIPAGPPVEPAEDERWQHASANTLGMPLAGETENPEPLSDREDEERY